MNQNEILKQLEADLNKIKDPTEKYIAMTIIAVGKSVAVLTSNGNWDMLTDMEQTIGSLFVQSRLVKQYQDNAPRN